MLKTYWPSSFTWIVFIVKQTLHFYFSISSASFEFQFLSSEGRFKPLPGRWLNDSVPVHVKVEVKVMPNPGMDKVVNLFVTSTDSESLKLFPENNPYNFTVV